MNRTEAYEILRSLVNGVEPVTGAPLPPDDCTQGAETLQALYQGMMALRPEEQETPRPAPDDALRPWSADEVEALELLRKAGVSVGEIAAIFNRRTREIEKILQSEDGISLVNRGKRWAEEEEVLLRQRYGEKVPLPDIARELRRGERAVYLRMEKLGLTGDGCGYPPAVLWTEEALRQTVVLARQGKSPEEIAAQVRIPVESVAARMFYMGLSSRAPVTWREGKDSEH